MSKSPELKNVLAIVFYFPPMGGSGIQRPLKFFKYLPEFGWNPIVICPEPGAYHTFDYSLESEVNQMDIEIHRVPGNTPLHISGNKKVKLPQFVENQLRKVSTFFWIPDNKKGWISSGFEKSSEIIRSKAIDAVYVTAPPYSNLLLAAKIKKHFNIPVIADMRDDWVGSHLMHFHTGWHKKKTSELERETLSVFDRLITINHQIKESISDRIPEVDISVIPHGYDEQDFTGLKPRSFSDEKIRILYSGTFYPESGPEIFMKAVATLFERIPMLKKEIELQFQGHFNDEYIQLAKELELEHNVQVFGYVDHKEAVNNLVNADVLWLNNTHKRNAANITLSKTYEYMASEKPILALIPEGDTKEILKEYAAAYFCSPTDIDNVSLTIEQIINAVKKNQVPSPNKKFINRFNRKSLTGELAQDFNVISS